jgi:serine/threonine protein kinase
MSIAAEADPGVTRAHSILGTPAYMAPEQFTNVKNAAPASDVYSLGILLYQAFTGARPFDGTTLETLFAAHATQAPRDIRQARPDLPEPLADIVTRCLAKNPAKRPAAKELARDLAPFAADAELTAEAKRCGVPRHEKAAISAA